MDLIQILHSEITGQRIAGLQAEALTSHRSTESALGSAAGAVGTCDDQTFVFTNGYPMGEAAVLALGLEAAVRAPGNALCKNPPHVRSASDARPATGRSGVGQRYIVTWVGP